MRGDIETRKQFVKRNVDWWIENERWLRKDRLPYYERFLKHTQARFAVTDQTILGEVGPGPFGGLMDVCKLPAREKYFIDDIMVELHALKFIDWPESSVMVDAPAEAIPLADNVIDVLLSYNALDHGWDIWSSIQECVRVSKHSFLSFDCRGNNAQQVEQRKGKDLDHWQLIKIEDVYDFMRREMSHCWSLTELGGKEFPIAVIEVKKNVRAEC
jgi:hypothetical protein